MAVIEQVRGLCCSMEVLDFAKSSAFLVTKLATRWWKTEPVLSKANTQRRATTNQDSCGNHKATHPCCNNPPMPATTVTEPKWKEGTNWQRSDEAKCPNDSSQSAMVAYAGTYVYGHAHIHVWTCVQACADMCTGMSGHVHRHVWICAPACLDMCTGMCGHVHRHV